MKTTLRRFRAHPWLTSVVVAVVVVGVGSYFATRSDSPAAAIATTTTTTVSTGTIKQSVSATGTLAPAKDESLNFSVAGTVTSVKVKVGQKVTKGQTLATVESASLAATVAQAKSTVASDKARVSDDEDNDASDTQLAADKAALAAAKNQLASAKDQLASATMTSSIDGAVAAVSLTVGESVSGSSSSSDGAATSSGGLDTSAASTSTAQVEVISTNSWIANATVDATSVDLIKTGNQAQLTISGATGTVYATIDSIGLVSSSTSGTASYPVVLDVTGSPTGLHDGASVTATLIYKQLANVVVISAIALHRNSTGGQYVNKLVNGKTVRTTVRVGLSSGGQTQITSGLVAGDEILVPQIQRITGGGTGTSGGTLPSFPGGGAGGGNFPGGGAGGGNFPGGGLGG